MSTQMSLDDRMKDYYEHAYRIKLPRRMPVILRLDGKAFHTFTRGMNKPFDKNLMQLMQDTMKYLLDNIQNAVLGYTQSDEISILIMNYKRLDTNSWYDNNLQKMVSVSAAMASSYFTMNYNLQVMANLTDEEINADYWEPKYLQFDSRAFVLPEAEVNNYFISRQNDCSRNSIQMMAQQHYSPKQLNGLSCIDLIHKMDDDPAVTKKYIDFEWEERVGTVMCKKLTANGYTGFETTQLDFRSSSRVIDDLLTPIDQ